MAGLQFSIRVDGVSDESLVVRSYQGQDNFSSVQQTDGSWCHGFRYQIELASRRPDLTALDMVDKSAELVMHQDGEVVQRINGIVRNFTQGETGHHHTFYALTLVPEIERLSLRHNSRIFQSVSAPDIIATLFKEMDIQNFAFALTRTPKLREFCMQYRETDLEFINRLAAEEGMVYHIEQSKGKHNVLFTDDSQVITSLDSPVPYNVMASGISSTPYIKEFSKTTQFEVSDAHSGDSSFKKPQYTFSQQAVANDMDYQRDTYEHFDAPGRFKDDAIGKEFNQLRLDSLRRYAHTAKGKGNEPQLQTGAKFELSEHSDDRFNKHWLIIASTHQGDQPQALEESAGGKPTTYANQFEAIPADKTWRMPQMTRPQVDGPMTAYVVGPEGEEIFCDEYGRVKLHFPWDRYCNGDEHSSCWVQVSQGWAGSQYGQIAIPRIGHEVIVSFLNGDPDQPIVTGRAFNAQNLPPYTLPDNKTKTVWRSETHQGEGFNEISFEDQSGSEQVYVHAQKDFKSETLNDHITDVNHDQHLTVENDQFTQIKNNHNLTVEGESRSKIAKDQTFLVDGNLQIKSGSVIVNQAANEIHVKSGNKVVIEAGAEITLKAGASFVKVDAAGVHLVGAGVNINSGGSAGSGSGFSGAIAELPLLVDNLEAPQIISIVNEKEVHALDSKFALNQLNGLPKVFDEHRFTMWLSGVFGHDIPPQAYLDFYQAIKSGSITNPPIEVVVGSVAYYDNKKQTIAIGKNLIKHAKEESGQEDKTRLLTILVHEFGHHVDYLLRNVFSNVRGDANLDEGAAFAVLLSNINMRKKTETVVANYQGSWGSELLSITYANMHNELQKQRSYIENDKKSQNGDREYFPAGGTAEQAKHGKYGHRSIEASLTVAFTEAERDTIYYGNWLRDYSQVVDIKLLEFNLDLLIGAADEQIEGMDVLQEELPSHLNTLQKNTEQIRTQSIDQLGKAKSNLKRFTAASSTQLNKMSSELSTYRSRLEAQTQTLSAARTDLVTMLNKRTLPSGSAEQIKRSIDNIDSAVSANHAQIKLAEELSDYVVGAEKINSLTNQSAINRLSSSQLTLADADIKRFFEQAHQSLPVINQLIGGVQVELKKGMALLEKVADIEVTDTTGITSGGRRVGSKAISRESLTQVVEILARKEFPERFAENDNSPFRVDPEKLGVYRPEEHLDNPKGITAPANPQYKDAFRGDYEASEGDIDPNTWYKNFFKDSISFAKSQLSLAANAGRTPQGLIHFGQALHVIEDIYAHSNFVELAINRLHREGKLVLLRPVNSWVKSVNVGSTQKVQPLTTGIFGASDTVVSLLSVLEKGSDHSTSAEKEQYQTQVSIMLVLLNDYQPNAVELLFDTLGLDYSSKAKSLTAEQALEAAKKADELSYFVRFIVKEFLNLLFLFSNQLKALIARQMMEAIKYAQNDMSPTDPTHTQLAKDPDDHPLHTIAAQTAQQMVATMGQEMVAVWTGDISLETLLSTAESFFVHPDQIDSDSPEHIKTLYDNIRSWARKNPNKLRMAAAYNGHLEHELEKLKIMSESSTEAIDWYVKLEKLLQK